MVIPGATVFLSSGCLMVFAMVVFRMTAAELGASLYTSTAVLTITLAGLALGGFMGGAVADRFHPRRTLSVLFALFSAAGVLVVMLNNAMKDWTGLWDLSWPLHVLLCVGLLLLLPAALLAATVPVAGRMGCGDGTSVGRVIGTLFAGGACGSVVGVVLAGFLLIPRYGNTAALWSISITTLALAFLYWVSCWILYVWGMVFGVLMLLAIAPAPWAVQSGTAAYLRTARPADVLYESQTLYSLASVKQVSQRPDTRVLSLDKNEQGTVLPGDATYIQGFPAAVGAAVLHGLFPLGSSPAILFLGSGGYVLPRYAGTVWPQSHIRVVEPDPGVTAAATIGLGLGSTMAETIRLDAGTYVSTAQVQRKRGGSVGRCDLVYAQFSNPFDVPFYLLTKQFDDKLSLLLSEKGVYVLSIADTAEGGRFLSAVVNTLEQTFLSVQVVARAVDRPAAVESFVVIAGPRPLNLTEMLTSDSACPPVRVLDAAATDQLKNRSAGLVLMDERAPVGTLLAPVVRADASLRLARKRFHQAVLLEGQGQGELCDVLYGQAAAADTPIQVDAYAAIGRRYLTQGDINKAGEAFGAALKCAIEHGAAVMTTAEIHAELAGVLRKINLLPQAKQHMAAAIKGFQTEVRWHPKSVVAWEHMGDAFVFQDDWSSASDVFSRCVELEPDYLTHYDKLAKALEMQHRYGEAAKTVRAQIVILKKTGRKEAADQQTHIAEYLEYQQAKQRG